MSTRRQARRAAAKSSACLHEIDWCKAWAHDGATSRADLLRPICEFARCESLARLGSFRGILWGASEAPPLARNEQRHFARAASSCRVPRGVDISEGGREPAESDELGFRKCLSSFRSARSRWISTAGSSTAG